MHYIFPRYKQRLYIRTFIQTPRACKSMFSGVLLSTDLEISARYLHTKDITCWLVCYWHEALFSFAYLVRVKLFVYKVFLMVLDHHNCQNYSSPRYSTELSFSKLFFKHLLLIFSCTDLFLAPQRHWFLTTAVGKKLPFDLFQ